MSTDYCESWFYGKAVAIGLLTEQQARARHKSGKPYTALMSNSTTPSVVIEVDPKLVSVTYLDGGFREVEQYEFEPAGGKGLFLTTILVRVLKHVSPSRDNEAIRDTHVFYEPSGLMTISERDYVSGAIEVSELTVELALNWKAFPGFGCYDHLLIGKNGLFCP